MKIQQSVLLGWLGKYINGSERVINLLSQPSSLSQIIWNCLQCIKQFIIFLGEQHTRQKSSVLLIDTQRLKRIDRANLVKKNQAERWVYGCATGSEPSKTLCPPTQGRRKVSKIPGGWEGKGNNPAKFYIVFLSANRVAKWDNFRFGGIFDCKSTALPYNLNFILSAP